MKKLMLLLLLISSGALIAQDTSMRVSEWPLPGGGGAVISGPLILYKTGGNNAIDGNDGLDFFGQESLCGSVRGGSVFSIESRAMLGTAGTLDTIFIRTVHHLGVGLNRSFVITFTNLTAASAGKIEDLYPGGFGAQALNINAAGNGSTIINFTINSGDAPDVASNSRNRFRIVLCTNLFYLRPFSFSQVSLDPQSNATHLGWSVENENWIRDYEIQISVNGRKFSSQKKVLPQEKKRYLLTEQDGPARIRIKANLIDGTSQYSEIIIVPRKLPDPASNESFTVFPNPVMGRVAHLRFIKDKGEAQITVASLIGGTVVYRSKIDTKGDQQVVLYRAVPGTYTLTIEYRDGTTTTKQLFVQ